jgi:3-oxoacyl-[acyl-carrier-protein] synthase II
MRRIVVTGLGLASPLGNDHETLMDSLHSGRSGITRMPEWDVYSQLATRVAGRVAGISASDFPRKKVRTMGRVGLLSLFATESAVAHAGLSVEALQDQRLGICYGSTHGSSSDQESFCRSVFESGGFEGIAGSAYLRFMSHTCAANLAAYYGVVGRVVPTIAACASGSLAIGTGYENILSKRQDIMLCGGAEELHFVHAGVFDIVYAASSQFNHSPELTPRPFDKGRDGLAVAEGAGTLVLEELTRAQERGATILAEIEGYGLSCDGTHVTNPSADGMAQSMELALRDAGIQPSDVGYINAHGTGTEVGDIAESIATHRVFGEKVPISSTKGHMGHTLGACGAIEAAICIGILQRGFLPPTRNLEEVDDRCAPLDYVMGEARSAQPTRVMSNNFAFGGINTSLIFKKYQL